MNISDPFADALDDMPPRWKEVGGMIQDAMKIAALRTAERPESAADAQESADVQWAAHAARMAFLDVYRRTR